MDKYVECGLTHVDCLGTKFQVRGQNQCIGIKFAALAFHAWVKHIYITLNFIFILFKYMLDHIQWN